MGLVMAQPSLSEILSQHSVNARNVAARQRLDRAMPAGRWLSRSLPNLEPAFARPRCIVSMYRVFVALHRNIVFPALGRSTERCQPSIGTISNLSKILGSDPALPTVVHRLHRTTTARPDMMYLGPVYAHRGHCRCKLSIVTCLACPRPCIRVFG
jgi:hypothetical protein